MADTRPAAGGSPGDGRPPGDGGPPGAGRSPGDGGPPGEGRSPGSRRSLTIAGVVGLVVVLALVGIALAVGPFGADGDTAAGGGARSTPLRALTERAGDGTKVTITGRVRPSDGRGPSVLHVTGRTDDVTSCPDPEVAANGTITPPIGERRIGWRASVGPAPGVVLPAGEPIRMSGTLVLPTTAIRRLCIRLARGGDRPDVVRTVAVALPDASASGGPGFDTPLEEDAVVLSLLVLIVVAVVAGTLAILVVEARRRGRAWALPALPADVRVPDVVPSEDPRVDATGVRRRIRRIGERRLEVWRASRQEETEKAGKPFDPHEKPPWHVAVWGVGDGAGRLAAERFRAMTGMYPDVQALHDRRVPGPRGATIDHLFVGPGGIVVASSSRWEGFVEVRDDRLVVAGKDRTAVVDGVVARVTTVRGLLGMAGYGGIPVRGALHCVETEDVLLNGSLVAHGIPVLDALGVLGLAADGEVLGFQDVLQIVAALERRLPPVG
ncbi:hypothetical protein [Patulibacter sp.]|uniref:hypothetical protein n=1 Tax=Patulibacter sp. TaxID=1912859 RepID=UPI002721DBDE|nr:hypothetical protein [Patulibacter sp.]MDO9410112.1 hypothetical protein [Patulibacter sp.]